MLKKYINNPILKPKEENEWENFCVLNPGVIYDENRKKFVMLYRAAEDTRFHHIRLGFAESNDGINFTRQDKPIFDVEPNNADGGCIEDPRIVKIDGYYYITYASRPFYPGRYWLTYEEYIKENGELPVYPETMPCFIRKNSTVSFLAYTKDFKTFKRLGKITDSRYDNRDVVIFPEKINGQFIRIDRPVFPKEHPLYTEKPSMRIAFSDDLMEWDNGELFYSGIEWWEDKKVGASCPPIKTDKGWILIYHGVSEKDNFYRTGVLLLDKDNPSKIIGRTKNFILEPDLDYEKNGLYNGCVFPTGCVLLGGMFYVYYGCADKFISVATIKEDELFSLIDEI